MSIDPRTPVIVGVGQKTVHWDPASGQAAPSPQSLRADAARLALADSGAADALGGIIDRVVAVRTMLDSVPGAPQPFGRCANPPGTVAADLGLNPRECIHSHVGGDQPQALVNESAAAIFAGNARAVLLTGSEATAAMKAALKAGQTLDWSHSAGDTQDDRGLGASLLSAYDVANGLGAPTQTYPAFEQALRARWGNSVAQHRALMSQLWSGFSTVAAGNPHAQFPVERSVEYLSTPSKENYPVADPYLKWDVAQDAVNQGAAVVLTSVGEADRLGITADKRVFLHGHGHAKDKVPSERPDLSKSLTTELVLKQALETSGMADASGIALYDLYSCFPVAVLLAAEALGLDWQRGSNLPGRAAALTLTGGLPFFGGAGNNYSMHGIAEMVTRLRDVPGQFGLVLANGGFLSKEAAGVYSTVAPAQWQPVSNADIQAACDGQVGPRLLSENAHGAIESWSVTWAKGVPQRGYAFVRTDDGARILARTRKDEAAKLHALADPEAIGKRVSIVHEDGINLIAF
jgi:acetyl-CoA C-acetyltransferase